MRALILKKSGEDPVLDDFNEPTAGVGEQVVKVLAASINPYDRTIAQDPGTKVPRVVGLEAVAQLENGERVYVDGAIAPFGTVAEKTLIKPEKLIELPEGLELGLALAAGISGLAAWLPLSWKAALKPGESVLVLGATGVQGQIAVQAARLLGAGHVVAAGRDRSVLEGLKSHGADEIVVLEGDMAQAIKAGAPQEGYHVVIDSLFGEPFTGLLNSGTLGADSRVVVLGGSAGQQVDLGFRQLQANKGASIAGYSTFFVPPDIKRKAYLTITGHALAGEIQVDVQKFPLDQAEQAWATQAKGPHSKIIVLP